MPEPADPARMNENTATLRWQARLRAWMQLMVTGVIVFFLVASGWQIYYVHLRIEKAPALDLAFAAGGSLSAEQEHWRTLARLEAHAIQQRYHQANVILMSRIWTTYLGFVTGMILAAVGAAFILGKLREQASEISGKSEAWQLSIASTSPGLIMVVLGTLLMLVTILTHHKIDVNDAPLYLGVSSAQTAPAVLPKPPALSQTRPDLPEAVKKLRSGLAADSLAQKLGASSSQN